MNMQKLGRFTRIEGSRCHGAPAVSVKRSIAE
jgi:hypothetical protein